MLILFMAASIAVCNLRLIALPAPVSLRVRNGTKRP